MRPNAQIHRARATAVEESVELVRARSGAIASWAAVSVNAIEWPFATHTQTATAVTLTCWSICRSPPCGVAPEAAARATSAPRTFLAEAEPPQTTCATAASPLCPPDCRGHWQLAPAAIASRADHPLARRRVAAAQAFCSPTLRFTGPRELTPMNQSTPCARLRCNR